jgi:galactose mutarotase-like enzyme
MSQTEQTVTLLSDELSADVALLGAELTWLDDSAGNSYLWNGDPAFWTSRAPILFPIVGCLAADTYRLGSDTYSLPRHGFARTSMFRVAARSDAHVTLRLEADDAIRAVWPFEFRLDVTHALAGRTLTTTAVVTNLGEVTMPASFGFHPAFRWPLPHAGAREHHRIRFETPEPAAIRRLTVDGCLRAEPEPSPVVGDTLLLADDLFLDGALIFDTLDSRRLVYEGETGTRLDVAFQGMPHLGIWTKPGAGYVCIEPWQGHADPAGFVGEIGEKPGMLPIAPGASRTFAMSVTFDFRRS